MKNQISSLPQRQHGVALFVALVFLVILTVLGITALGNNNLQTRMAYGSSETNFAFQSADSALAAGEAWLAMQGVRPINTCGTNPSAACTDPVGIWPRTPTPIVTGDQLALESFWLNSGRKLGFTYVENATPAQVVGQDLTGTCGTNCTPAYIIEDMGTDISSSLVNPGYQIYYYQITARGFGAQANSRTVVQSVYARGF